MRITASVPFVALLSLGCTEPADPGETLLDFAELMADDLYDALWTAVEDGEGLDMWHLDDGASFSGNASLSGGSEASGVDGELTADWALEFELTEYDDGVSNWYWDIDIDIERLALPDAEVAGSGAWSLEHEYYDYDWRAHSFDGQLAIDGGELQDVSFDAYFSGNLHWVQGSIGGVEVDWENDNPDLP